MVGDLFVDLRSGHNLITLLEILTQERLVSQPVCLSGVTRLDRPLSPDFAPGPAHCVTGCKYVALPTAVGPCPAAWYRDCRCEITGL